jgi:hypothetical protein
MANCLRTEEKAQTFPENVIKGRINIFEVKAYSYGNHMIMFQIMFTSYTAAVTYVQSK